MKNEHAFFQIKFNERGGCELSGGLSKREYFAAMAMQGLMSSDWAYKSVKFYLPINVDGSTAPEPILPKSLSISALAVSHADALIEELERTKEKE